MKVTTTLLLLVLFMSTVPLYGMSPYPEEARFRQAAQAGDSNKVKYWLDRNMSINAKSDASGNTALHGAARSGHFEVVQLLLDRGSDSKEKNYKGMTALDMALQYGHQDIINLLSFSALKHAIRTNDRDAVTALLDKGAYVNAKSAQNGWTALHFASAQDRPGIVTLLLAQGADSTLKDPAGFTPLHYAALHGNTEVVQILLNAGAHINAKTNAGKTPLDLARQHSRIDAIDLLVRAGADTGTDSEYMYE